jgi:NADPH-ferrihemoprotein reductase
MAKTIDATLRNWNGHLLGKLGLGDDGKGTLEDNFLSWKDSTLHAIAAYFGLPKKLAEFQASFEIEECRGPPTVDTFVGEPNKLHLGGKTKSPFTASNPLPAAVIHSRSLFTKSDRTCLHIEFDISASILTYETGDHLAVRPMNSNLAVDEFLKIFGLEKGTKKFEFAAVMGQSSYPFRPRRHMKLWLDIT